jgi:hypothetical protein
VRSSSLQFGASDPHGLDHYRGITSKRPVPFTGVDAMDATHYRTRNVGDTGWKYRYWMDTALDVTAGERIRTESMDSPATAS